MTSPPAITGSWRRWIHPPRSVRVRITLAAVLVTAVAVGTAGWLLVRSVEDTQLSQFRHDVNATLDQVAARLQDGDDPQEAIEAVAATHPLEVTDQGGNVVASFPSGGASVPPRGESFPPGNQPESVQSPDDEPVPNGATETVRGGNATTAPSETITRNVETPTGQLTLTALVPVDQVARSIDALRQALVVGLPALIALVAALAWVIVGRALRPVDAIRAEVDEITGTTMHRRVPDPPTDDEIGRLARTMNAMLARLDTTATRQRQFVSDASHELRSPVTTIRAGLEVALDLSNRANWPAVAKAALAEESRLEALLDDLLLLAASDENGTDALPTAPVNLTALTHAEARRPRRIPVHLTHPPATTAALMVHGDPDQLARMITNLVDNAARYATTAIHIAITAHHDTIRLTIDDDGPGIPPHQRERIFERFTRLDNSRTRHQGGTGLGLALVHTIVTHHHGRVRVQDSPTGGARFVIDLPTHQTTDTPTPITPSGPATPPG